MGEIEHPLPLLNCDESGFVLWESIGVQRVADAEPQMREEVVGSLASVG
jgi:hypothetical protein